MLYFAIILLVVLLFLGRDELGLTGIGVTLLIFLAAFGVYACFDISPGYFMAFTAVLDIVLVLKIFSGDLSI